MIDRQVSLKFHKYLKQYPVLTVSGPRQSGKTTLCKTLLPKYKYVSLENFEMLEFAKKDPKGFLKNYSNKVIIDEIQKAPDLLSYIQGIVDDNNVFGNFVLTGSQQFELLNKVTQSLAGRTALIKLLPFSLDELKSYSDKSILEYKKLCYKGFYPRIYNDNVDPYEAISFYINTYLEKDLRLLTNIKDLSAFNNFLKLCAGRSAQILNLNSLSNDSGVSVNTVKAWISILEASFIIYRLPAYFTNINKRLIKTQKLYFYDVGLLSHLLGIKQDDQVLSHPLRGQIFETMIVSEFYKIKYNLDYRFDLYYYQDSNKSEVDLIIDDGNFIKAVEIKSSETITSSFFKSLNNFKKNKGLNIKTYLIYAGDESYTREQHNICSYKNILDIFK